jgi:hypothetical protein
MDPADIGSGTVVVGEGAVEVVEIGASSDLPSPGIAEARSGSVPASRSGFAPELVATTATTTTSTPRTPTRAGAAIERRGRRGIVGEASPADGKGAAAFSPSSAPGGTHPPALMRTGRYFTAVTGGS